MRALVLLINLLIFFLAGKSQEIWQSRYVGYDENQRLVYFEDEKGNIIPDFSNVGYASGNKEIPDVHVVEILNPLPGDNRAHIQGAIDRVAALKPDRNGFRGTVLLKSGVYNVNGSIFIRQSGIVIRGEGSDESGTLVRATAKRKHDLFCFTGNGDMEKDETSKVALTESYIPAGRKHIELLTTEIFMVGDSILLYRPSTGNWISDLKMDQIIERPGTRQWKADDYHLYFERVITAIEGNRIYMDNPVVMPMEQKYGGGFVMKYTFNGRIKNCGIENMLIESAFESDTDENHGWTAVIFTNVRQSWARNLVSRYFGYGCVTVDRGSRNISVLDSKSLDAKSQITGSRRYSFSCRGQLNLFKNLYSTEGRHDYSTGARVLGPNVFTQCTARNTHSDIGPHHRWAVGTLYDMIDTDGAINIQDRGNLGTGHGWTGVTQVVWNSKSPQTSVQSPWVSGKNYCIGLMGNKYEGRFKDRPDGEWEGLNTPGLMPESLYEAQLKNRLNKTK